MPLHSRKNQYRGINAHLNSLLQNERAGWPTFRGMHIAHLAEAIDAALPPGYVALPEQAMQIRQFHPHSGERVIEMKTITLPAREIIDDPDAYLTAVAIRHSGEGGPGDPVTWLEVLSPTNKQGGDGYAQYLAKRGLTLQTGVVLVELDYLHQSPPVDDRIPSYSQGEDGAYPYLIAMTDPRPTLDKGSLNGYGFTVDSPVPALAVPLAEDDTVMVDFGGVYNRTYESLRAYSLRVDYAEEPVRFQTYSQADRQRIRARMAAVRRTAAQGIDLESGPFAIEGV